MPHRRMVYIAGPYRGKDRAEESENVLRAAALSRLAIKEGLSPIVVHPGIYLGAYGDDGDEEQRARGLDVAIEIVRAVAEAGGSLWVIRSDDGRLSEGTQRELDSFAGAISEPRFAAKGEPTLVRIKTWDQWVEAGARLAWGITVEDE